MKEELKKLSHVELLDKMFEVFEETNFVIHRKLNNEQLKVILPEGITTEQISVLRYLKQHNLATSTELADYLCVNKSTITSTITRMVNKGLVTRIPSKEDRRVTFLSMTDDARELLAQMRAQIKQYFKPYIDVFDPEKAVEYIAATSYLASILKKDI